MVNSRLRHQAGAQAAKIYPGEIRIALSASLVTSGVLAKLGIDRLYVRHMMTSFQTLKRAVVYKSVLVTFGDRKGSWEVAVWVSGVCELPGCSNGLGGGIFEIA